MLATYGAMSRAKEAHREPDKPSLADPCPSQQSVNRLPFLSSKTEGLVWKWDQSKLCGQSINIILQSTLMPQDHPCNRPDWAREFVLIENDNAIVQPPAYLTRLKPEQYQVGLVHKDSLTDMKIILLGLPKWKKPSKVKESVLRLENYLARKSFPLFYDWSTESWISDSVVIDPRSTDEIAMIDRGKRTAHSHDAKYICIGLPATTMGPLFNTLVSSWNASPACFEYAIGFIWVYALIDPGNFYIELDTVLDPACDPVASMLRQMKGGSWVAVSKLSLQLEGSSRMKHSILVQVLGVSQARATSTHKPITHR
ncbi:hypothetical protein N7450_011629 [Penicillium hetheringtonii]|uniref:Uncharacterized protein n=1 Tax=Penicillium hetheringtonii TaxID=911720 RepID=A0AAD6DAJ0_9EURO|nr:hypothetical protein N7450_011629 [Penicillium hetheringtonii]